jgi:transposase
MAKRIYVKEARRAQELKAKGLSDREVGKIMGKHHRQIQRWKNAELEGDVIHST